MKKIVSSSLHRPYVFSFYLKPAFGSVDRNHSFPCMTHAFHCSSFSALRNHLRKLLLEYHHLGIDLEVFFEDSIDSIDVDDIVQHYDSQLNIPY